MVASSTTSWSSMANAGSARLLCSSRSPTTCRSRFIHVFIDLQGRTHTSLDRFQWWLAREISRAVSQAAGQSIPIAERELFTQDGEYLATTFLPEVLSKLGGIDPAADLRRVRHTLRSRDPTKPDETINRLPAAPVRPAQLEFHLLHWLLRAQAGKYAGFLHRILQDCPVPQDQFPEAGGLLPT